MASSRSAFRFVMAFTVSLALASCSGGRSTAAFCETLVSEQDRIRANLDASLAAASSQDDELVALLMSLGAGLEGLGELRTYTKKLAAVAPEEIRLEADLVVEAIEEQLAAASDSSSNPLASISKGIFAGMTAAGPISTVDSFARTNCGRGL